MEVARSLDHRLAEEALFLSHEQSFFHLISCLPDIRPPPPPPPRGVITSRFEKSRETFAREFANFSIRQ